MRSIRQIRQSKKDQPPKMAAIDKNLIMASWTKKEIIEAALIVIAKHKLTCFTDVVQKLPISRANFYNKKCNLSQEIINAIETNKVDIKETLRQKMLLSDSAGAWIALYKIVGTKEERIALSGKVQLLLDSEGESEADNDGGKVILYLPDNKRDAPNADGTVKTDKTKA